MQSLPKVCWKPGDHEIGDPKGQLGVVTIHGGGGKEDDDFLGGTFLFPVGSRVVSARHLAEIGLPACSLGSAGLLGPVLDGPVCDEAPLGGQIGWVDVRGGHVGEKLEFDGGFF